MNLAVPIRKTLLGARLAMLHHNLDGRIRLAHRTHARIDDVREVRRLAQRNARHLRVDFVAHLHHVGSQSRLHERIHGRLHVVIGELAHLGIALARPGSRNILVADGCPRVAHVEIQEESHVVRLDALGERDGMFQVAPAHVGICTGVTLLGVADARIYEGAHADKVDSVILQDIKEILLLAVIVVFCPQGLVFEHPRDIDTHDIRARKRRNRHGTQNQRRFPDDFTHSKHPSLLCF